MIVVVDEPFTRKRGMNCLLDAWRCAFCPRVELTLAKIRLHVAVEHGVRPISKERMQLMEVAHGIEVRSTAK